MAKSVLIIDDEPVIIEIAERKLQQKGYDVMTAMNGLEAFDRLKECWPDIIVLDIEMPKMNGYTFLTNLRKMPDMPNIPVIVLTAYDTMRPIFERHGITAYLLKPLKLHDLILKISRDHWSACLMSQLKAVQEQIARICTQIGRSSDEITLVGVTKYAQIDAIQPLLDEGLMHVAENHVQEGKDKFAKLNISNQVTKHMIGHLQSNKAKDAIAHFDLIQSVDRIKLVRELEKRALQQDKTVNILLQVNTAGEEQKFGVEPNDLNYLVDSVLATSKLNILGLMAMAPFTDDECIIHQCFSDLRQLFEGLKTRYKEDQVQMKYLSMGMSGDYPIALKEGANMLRIGSALFK